MQTAASDHHLHLAANKPQTEALLKSERDLHRA